MVYRILSAQNSRHTTAVHRSSIIDERRENAQHHGGKLSVSCCDRIVQLWRWWPGGYEKRGVNRTTPIAMKCLHTIVEMGRETYMHVVYNNACDRLPFFQFIEKQTEKKKMSVFVYLVFRGVGKRVGGVGAFNFFEIRSSQLMLQYTHNTQKFSRLFFFFPLCWNT